MKININIHIYANSIVAWTSQCIRFLEVSISNTMCPSPLSTPMHVSMLHPNSRHKIHPIKSCNQRFKTQTREATRSSSSLVDTAKPKCVAPKTQKLPKMLKNTFGYLKNLKKTSIIVEFKDSHHSLDAFNEFQQSQATASGFEVHCSCPGEQQP